MRRAPQGMTVVAALGAGSMFEVAIVRDDDGREHVAKRARRGGDGGAPALAREAQVLTACVSPHLPALIRMGADEDGAYLVESRAPGAPLRARIPPPGAPPLPAGIWSAIAVSTSSALAELHALSDARGALGLAHGDVSPDNVVFAPPGHTTFVDLSSASFRDARAPVAALDRGTLPYAAPELARNETFATQESDTYALAAVLLALAVGTICEADTAASRLLEIGSRGVSRDRILAREDLPPRSRDAVHRALAFTARHRLRSSAELSAELRADAGAPLTRTQV